MRRKAHVGGKSSGKSWDPSKSSLENRRKRRRQRGQSEKVKGQEEGEEEVEKEEEGPREEEERMGMHSGGGRQQQKMPEKQGGHGAWSSLRGSVPIQQWGFCMDGSL